MKKILACVMFAGLFSVACKEEPAVVKTVDCIEEEISLYLHEEHAVEVKVLPENAEDKDCAWEIADKTIASVEGNTFVGLKTGETWAVVFNVLQPNIKDSLKITVMEYPKKSISINDENIHYEGRISIDESSVSYLYPGTSFTVDFTGTSLNAKFNGVEAYYWIEIDDQEPFKICSSKKLNLISKESGVSTYWLAKDLKFGTHTARVTLCSEGIYKNPVFYGFEIDEQAELSKPAEKSIKFEFIGNSITCGYGTEVTDRSEFRDSVSNFCHTYSYATAKAFNAEIMVVARSGIGIYRNYGNADHAEGYGSMPDNYEKLWLQSSKKWDFSKYTPDVVFINLGTNDTWEMETFDSTKYDNSFRGLLDKVFSHYPNAKAVLLTGSMMNATAQKAVKQILNKIQTDYNTLRPESIYRYDFTATAGTGADWHPCAAQQAKMAEKLIKYLENNNICTK
ncbi:MAG: GDSL-type esterase/lipase family protein [Bacteroidales bacterium]|nr:GDSL-type esterase/lipase family protein [Bacteroidales bacterium]